MKLYGMSTQEGPLLIVTELMPKGENSPLSSIHLSFKLLLYYFRSGSLDKYIKQHQELLDKNHIILDMGTQICSAMKFLHARGLIHGDLVRCIYSIQDFVKGTKLLIKYSKTTIQPSQIGIVLRLNLVDSSQIKFIQKKPYTYQNFCE